MKNSKLFDLIRSLKEEEIRMCSFYLDYACKGKKTLATNLWTLIHQYPNLEHKKLEKEMVFHVIFKSKDYNENRISKVMSELYKLIIDFLITQSLKDNEIEHKLITLKIFQERNLPKLFEPTLKEIEKNLQHAPEGYRKNMVSYETEIVKLNHDQTLENRQLDYQKVYNKLENLAKSEQLRWKNLSQINMDNSLLEEGYFSTFYLIHKYLQESLSEINQHKFNQTYLYIATQIYHVDKEEAREILSILLEIGIRLVNKGIQGYDTLLNIYQLFIDRNVILENNNTIFLATYKNYITCCLKMKQIEQAAHFLETYKNFLPKEVRDDAYHFNKAQILFEKGAFDQVQTILNTIKSTDIFYKINQRRLSIKTFYELLQQDGKYFDIYQSYCVAFKKFIYTDEKIPEYLRDANKSFLKILQKIENLDTQSTTKQQKILKELNETPSVAERDWLKNKIAFRMEEE